MKKKEGKRKKRKENEWTSWPLPLSMNVTQSIRFDSWKIALSMKNLK